MLVYRTQRRNALTAPMLARLRRSLARAERSGATSHDQVTEWLIDFGEFEAGVMDALCPEADADSRTARTLRKAAILFGHAFADSWEKKPGEVARRLPDIAHILDELAEAELPVSAPVSPPEGYAYYGLFPETYLESANAFFLESRPLRAVCVGVRSIGASLSAVVGAVLERRGVTVKSYTARPRGHPFDRRLWLDPRLAEEWRSLADSHFLIVDEGPGLSGSSLCCLAQKLAELGVPDARVVFFPSWLPDGSQFVNQKSRELWGRRRKYATDFERVWIDSGRLTRDLPRGDLADISGGKWRSLFYNDEDARPAAHPQHERRKYVLRGVQGETAKLWLKFAGLGRYGKAKQPRADALAAAGFAPRALGFSNGFVIMDFVNGRPLTRKDVDSALLTKIARYLAFLKSDFGADGDAAREEVVEMARVNVAEGLGRRWAERLARSGILERAFDGASACAIDGRMLPHEWLRVGDDYLKTDGLDHHDDHFYPGCQEIAWDLAGSCVEFALDRRQADYLVGQYRALVHDPGVTARLPFYLIAYAAFRLGYSTMAAKALRASPDGAKFNSLRRYYASRLKREIDRL
ncbi:MAG TPA: hypothetical protein VIM99_01310 [Blastocatellia bacterium]